MRSVTATSYTKRRDVTRVARFETSLAGLYVTGFASTRDFGPFYGFTKGCPSSARIAVAEMLR